MLKMGVLVLMLCTVLALAGPAQAQLFSPLAVAGLATGSTPTVAYCWYQPASDDIDSGRGFEGSVTFSLSGPIKGRLQYMWPQTGDYSNLGLAAMMSLGDKLYAGAGYERTRGQRTTPVEEGVKETQPYAFIGLISKGTAFAMTFEAERSFGDELNGTTYKVGFTTAW